jgi:hypothetical protein
VAPAGDGLRLSRDAWPPRLPESVYLLDSCCV